MHRTPPLNNRLRSNVRGNPVTSATGRTSRQPPPAAEHSLIDLEENDEASRTDCKLCDQPNNLRMVQCDTCNEWFHFSCVNVDESVADRDWDCADCVAAVDEVARQANIDAANTDANEEIHVAANVTTTNDLNRANLTSVDTMGNGLSLTEIAMQRLKLLEEKEKLIEERLKTLELLERSTNEQQQVNTFPCPGPTASSSPATAPRQNTSNMQFASRPQQHVNSTSNNLNVTESFLSQIQQLVVRQSIPNNLPTFSGRPEEWPAFISSFNHTTTKGQLTNDDNLQRLRQCLKGKAREAVESQLALPECVPDIISTLETAFGRATLLVKSQIDKIRREPKMNDKFDSIIHFSFLINNLIATLKAANLPSYLNNVMLEDEIVKKLSDGLQMNWAAHKRRNASQVEADGVLISLALFIKTVAEDASSLLSEPLLDRPSKKRPQTDRVNIHEERQTKPKCLACSEDCKSVDTCTKFINSTTDERWDLVKQNRLCRSCFKRHGYRCNNAKKCDVNGCDRLHHPLLHSEPRSPPSDNLVNLNCNHNGANKSSLFRIIPVTLSNGSKSVDVFAFLDEGSSVSLMEKDLADEINLSGSKLPLHLQWTGNQSRVEDNSIKTNVLIHGENPRKKYNLSIRTVNSLDLPEQTLDYENICTEEPTLKRLPIRSYRNARPRLLIGINSQRLTVPLKVRHGERKPLIATKCKLGWTISGCLSKLPADEHCQLNYHTTGGERLDEMFQEYMSMESLGITQNPLDLLTLEERRALDMMQKVTTKVGNTYETRLLWKEEEPTIPDSYPMAFNRLVSLESRLRKDPALKNACEAQIQLYLERGYIRKLSESELKAYYKRIWYLPIFPVINKNKPGKVRLVWDAAAKVNGVSLNSLLMTGPDITASLLSVLMSFRERKFALSGDIEQMFHRVAINPEDQHAQRFLWRNCDTNKDPDVYVMQVMTFGSTSSPFQAQFIKNTNAESWASDFAKAVSAIILHTYVDDTLTSFDTEEETVMVARQMKEVNAKANFNIRNWHSNSRKVLDALGETNEPAPVNMNKNDGPEKVLGMWWLTEEDTLTYSLRFNKVYNEIINGTRTPTKREVLSMMMAVYDPLGLIAHFMVSLKIIFKEIWQSGIEWDESILEPQFLKWKTWAQNLATIEQLKIPRCYLNNLAAYEDSIVTLQGFSDAGREAMAATVFIRIQRGDAIQVSLVAAKTKIGPTTPTSIPRLELQAAVILARLITSVKKALTVNISETFLWCDSRSALAWIQNTNMRLNQFVAYRVSEIRSTTRIKSWRFVCSEDNAADDGTKLIDKPNLHYDSRWFQGPKFLYQAESEWPQPVTVTHHRVSESLIDISKYRTWPRLVRAMAYAIRFKNSPNDKGRFINSDELKVAEDELFKLAQQQYYGHDYRCLKLNRPIDEESTLYRLSPYLDTNGIIRIRGRIDQCKYAEYNTKRPIILPAKHHITSLLIMDEHERVNHRYNDTVVNNLRQKFFIPCIRATVKTVVKECQYCKYQKAIPLIPEMAELPAGRICSYALPFTHTGVDFFGPYQVTIGRRTEKRWGVIFTCLTSRAIHIELAESLSTDVCIRVVRNFMCRRGTPQMIYCDRGTNFVGSENELRKQLQQIDPELIANNFVSPNITWRFNPPDAAHMGGPWESLIKSIKRCLEPKLTNRNPTPCELMSYMIEVEHIINSRPLTYLPLEAGENEALTPNHLLLGSSTGCKPMAPLNNTAVLSKVHGTQSNTWLKNFGIDGPWNICRN